MAKHPLKALASAFIAATPPLNAQEQWVSLTLYGLLFEREPVAIETLAEATNIPSSAIKALLKGWPGVHYDEVQHIIGYWGLTISPTQHQLFTEGNKTLYTWCAWDGLFIPPLVKQAVFFETHCPMSKQKITLQLDAMGKIDSLNSEYVMSFLQPNAIQFDSDVISKFCHFIYLFNNTTSAKEWLTQNTHCLLVSLPEALTLSQLKNQHQYRDVFDTQENDASKKIYPM